ncbi:MAG TPA: SGNH/GDSL hydrolase family protein [Bryobacteraceae bacterium]
MRTIRRIRMTFGALLAAQLLWLLWLAPIAKAEDHWVATWAASPQAPRVALGRGPAPAPATAPARANQAPAFPAPPTFNNTTVREIVRTSIGGRRARVQLSNVFGTTPLKIGAAHVALRDKESAILGGSDHALTFSGNASFTIPPGAEVISDPVDIEVPKLGDLVLSLYIPGEGAAPTQHLTGLHTTYISKATGDLTAAPSIADATKTQAWYWISSVDVLAPADTKLIVAFGDSITDGATSTPDTDSSWPSQLAKRLLENKATSHLAIVNQGISGNRVLADGAGVSALARFDRDVLSQPGVEWLIVMEGINDIGLAARTPGPNSITADDLIAAQKQLINRAHMHGIKVIGATLTPYSGAAYYSDNGETVRTALNEWIRSGKAYDAVIDFDAATRDPENPKQIRPSFNIRDHLHPNDVGYKAMADAFDLSMFKRK